MDLQFDSLADFLHMAGHGVFVLSVYAVVIVTLILLALIARWRFRQLRSEVLRQVRLEAIEQQRAQQASQVTPKSPDRQAS